jgi:branched-chain amino acid transport system substrate-binding protein
MVKLPPVLASSLLVALLPGGVAAGTGGVPADVPARPEARPVTLGLFLPDRGPEAPAGQEALRGAGMAADWANRTGGIQGRPLRLVTASSDVPWSAATDALVRLIYDENAVAIVGALDGPTGHLAEQVITRAKGQTVFITPWASETTLTRIGIPWFFQMVPDDRRQGKALAREIFEVRRVRRAAVYVGKGLDPGSASAAFEKQAPAGAVSRFEAGNPGALNELTARSARGDFGAVVLYANAGAAVGLVRTLSRTGSAPALLAPLTLARPELLGPGAGNAAEGMLFPSPAGLWSAPAASEFQREFRKRHGTAPTPLAAYAHDAVKVLVEALRKLPAPESDGLARALAGIRAEGVTGEIRFDNHLGRDCIPVLARVSGDRLVYPNAALPAGRR